MKKILIYNWCPFNNKESAWGGVNVYSRNLVNILVKNGYDVYFLSSGYKYSPFKNSLFVKEIDENIKKSPSL